jgi:hypothetical protein
MESITLHSLLDTILPRIKEDDDTDDNESEDEG